jgi:hypothetical protein
MAMKIYGDDNVAGYPKVMSDIIGLHKFAEWAEEVAGFKWKGEINVQSHCIGKRYYKTIEKGGRKWYLEQTKRAVDSPVFIKNKAVEVFIDDKSVGILPHRSFDSIIGKLFGSLTAMRSPIDTMSQLLSLGYLSIGNPEAHCIVEKVYEVMMDLFKFDDSMIMKRIKEIAEKDGNRTSYSVFKVLARIRSPQFPSLEYLWENHEPSYRNARRRPIRLEDDYLKRNFIYTESYPLWDQFVHDVVAAFAM